MKIVQDIREKSYFQILSRDNYSEYHSQHLKKFIDTMIECAIDNEYHELYVELLNFKRKYNLFDDDIAKRFEL